jgi:cytokinin dehydrogenase
MLVEPASPDDVLFVLKTASDHGVPVSVRGSGHGQSGQCLSERSIVLNMRQLSRVEIATADRIALAEGGATWRHVVDEAFAQGLLPRGLTLVTDATVAGTLSVGGVGGESFRIGAQVNNVLYLDVAMLDGRIVRASPEENRDIYDCVRSGLGQCGVILRAAYPLRSCKAKLRTYFFAYRDAEACVSDLLSLHGRPRTELVLGFLTPAADKGWTILLALGKEFDREEELADDDVGAGLRYAEELPSKDAPLWDKSGIPGHLFFRMHTGGFWNAGGAPQTAHPWVDHLFTPETAIEALAQILANPPAPLRMGTCGLIPVAVSGHRAPLFALPRTEGLLIGLGMFPDVPAILKEEARAIMSDYSRRGCDAGGKRYLSGFVDFDTEPAWAEHFGAVWPWFHKMKNRCDPRCLLNPGFLTWH